MKKKTTVLALAGLAACLGVGVAAVAGASLNIGGLNIIAANHESTHTLKEKAYEAPGIGKEGFKPYWLCAECCSSSVLDARYDFEDRTQNVTIDDITIPALTGATSEEVKEGDLISSINTKKFKYVDQGINGVDGVEGESTPVYIKDSDKTALFFSRSGKTGDAYDAKDNTNCSEFRFSLPSEYSKIKSFSFSYRVLDYGEGVWAGGVGESEPEAWRSMIQLKDSSGYHGYAFNFNSNDKWNKATFNIADWNIGDVTTNLTDIIIKFVDLRGHIMISDLNVEQALTVTLKNVNADGTTSTASVFEGQLPEAPTMEGKKFAGWYDEEGNKVTGVDKTVTTLVAKWSVDYYTDYNPTRGWTNEAADYGKVEGCEGYWTTRGNDRDPDIAGGRYPGDAGSEGFYPSLPSNETATIGLVLTPYDFSKTNAARFTIGFSDKVDNGLYVNGVNCGALSAKNFYNYEIEVSGKTGTVTNAEENKSYSFELTDEMYNGTKGIEIKTTGVPYRWMLVTKIVSIDCDYVETCKSIESELSDTLVTDGIEKASIYKALRTYFSAYENESYPLSEKMNNWVSNLPERVLKSEDSEEGRQLARSGNIYFSKSHYDFIFSKIGSSFANPLPCPLDPESYIAQVHSLSDSYGCFTLPNINFSKYTRVEFAMGFGGHDGGGVPLYALGLLSIDKVSIADLPSDSRYIGSGISSKSGIVSNGWNNATDVKVTVADGKISFVGSVSGISKTMDLDPNIYNGNSGLSFTVTGVSYEYFAVSPATGYYF